MKHKLNPVHNDFGEVIGHMNLAWGGVLNTFPYSDEPEEELERVEMYTRQLADESAADPLDLLMAQEEADSEGGELCIDDSEEKLLRLAEHDWQAVADRRSVRLSEPDVDASLGMTSKPHHYEGKMRTHQSCKEGNNRRRQTRFTARHYATIRGGEFAPVPCGFPRKKRVVVAEVHHQR